MVIIVLAFVSIIVAFDSNLLVSVLSVSALNLNIKKTSIKLNTARLLQTSSMVMQQIFSRPRRPI